MNETVRIGLLGSGTVGGALIRLIEQRREIIDGDTGLRLEVTRVAVRRPDIERGLPIPAEAFTADSEAVAVADDVDIVVELIGGLEPARTLILTALAAGKPVVTGNKDLLATHGPELYAAADQAGVDLLFEAAVGGGIPILRPLRESLLGEDIGQILGIVNGTTNYMLSRMTLEGATYDEVFAEADALGYLEADPSLDIDGKDAGAKVAIMASLAFGRAVSVEQVALEGIGGITAADIAQAKQMGYVIKLLGIAEVIDGEVAARVHPTLVPLSHPLASVNGSFNAVFVHGGAAGELMFYGRGAGGEPTASAVLGDVIDAALDLRAGVHRAVPAGAAAAIRAPGRLRSAFYLTLAVLDETGVLAAVAAAFSRNGVSIRSMEQHDDGAGGAKLTLVTHEAVDDDLRATLAELDQLDVVAGIGSVLRVIEADE